MRKAEYASASTAAAKKLQAIGLVKSAAWDDRTDSQRRALLTDYSSVSVFSDDRWFIDKKEAHPKDDRHDFEYAFVDYARV